VSSGFVDFSANRLPRGGIPPNSADNKLCYYPYLNTLEEEEEEEEEERIRMGGSKCDLEKIAPLSAQNFSFIISHL